MSTIRENDFRHIDLNLLIVLLVLHREGSVSRAAQKLHLGQPAVSGALARLRVLFNDVLFVRTAKSMVPTPRTEALIAALAPMMEQMQQLVFQPPAFDALHDVHTFRIGMSDWVESWIMPALMAALAQQAPGIDIVIVATDPFRDGEKLQQDKVDVALSVGQQTPAGLIRDNVTNMSFATLWDPNQLDLPSPLSLADYVAHQHLLVSYLGASHSAIDDRLAEHGYTRRVRYVSPHFSSLPLIIKQMPALVTVPAGLSRSWQQHYQLAASRVPVETADISLSLLWHKRRDGDPALQWLLALLQKIMRKASG